MNLCIMALQFKKQVNLGAGMLKEQVSKAAVKMGFEIDLDDWIIIYLLFPIDSACMHNFEQRWRWRIYLFAIYAQCEEFGFDFLTGFQFVFYGQTMYPPRAKRKYIYHACVFYLLNNYSSSRVKLVNLSWRCIISIFLIIW